jgi:hypothetical protein
MEWRLEVRSNHHYPWALALDNWSIPMTYDEVTVKAYLRTMRSRYPDTEFRVLKVLNW